MTDALSNLTQQEILALALEASGRGDSGHAMAYLKQAAAQADATAPVVFMLGSEYAQVGMKAEALACFERAVDIDPSLAIARFQLGFLHLSEGRAQQAQEVLSGMAALADQGGQATYLAEMAQGLCHLMVDQFEDCRLHLNQGIALNLDNPALNDNMRKLLAALDAQTAAPQPTEEPAPAPEGAHLFINSYVSGDKH